jgi:hypothetical protein
VDAIIGLRGNVPVTQQIVFASRAHGGLIRLHQCGGSEERSSANDTNFGIETLAKAIKTGCGGISKP